MPAWIDRPGSPRFPAKFFIFGKKCILDSINRTTLDKRRSCFLILLYLFERFFRSFKVSCEFSNKVVRIFGH